MQLGRVRGLAPIDRGMGAAGVSAGTVPVDADAIMSFLISIRKELRKARQFQLADEIRNSLSEIGLALEDTPRGTVWKRKR